MKVKFDEIDALSEEAFDALASKLADRLVAEASLISNGHPLLAACAIQRALTIATLLIATSPDAARNGLEAAMNDMRALIDDPAALARDWHDTGARYAIQRDGEQRKQ